MNERNRRLAPRVPLEVPVRIQAGEASQVLATLVDISRTGVRLRIPGSALRVHRLSTFAQVARQVTETLGEQFHGEIHYQQLGPLINKHLKTVRIAKRDWETTDVELGCIMCDDHLNDLEAKMLGIRLPALGEEELVAETAGNGQNGGASDTVALKAYIYACDERTDKPIVARTGALTRGMAFLTVVEGGDHLLLLDVASAAVALDDAFGSKVVLRIANAEDDLWVGPAEIKEIDVGAGPGRGVKLGVAFARELRNDELMRLGLPAPA